MVETVTSTSIADLPDWQKTYMKEILDRAQALGKDNYTLPAYNVAERTPLQQQATQLAQQGVGSYAPMLQGAAGSVGTGIAATQAGLNPLAQSITSAGQIGSTTAANILNPNAAQAYMNPYEQAVIDQTMQDIQRQSNIQQQGLDAQSVGQTLSVVLARASNAQSSNVIQSTPKLGLQQGYASLVITKHSSSSWLGRKPRDKLAWLGRSLCSLARHSTGNSVRESAAWA